MKLWDSQLNMATFLATSMCGIGMEQFNSELNLVRSVYRFHIYYTIRKILKYMNIPTPLDSGFKRSNNYYDVGRYRHLMSQFFDDGFDDYLKVLGDDDLYAHIWSTEAFMTSWQKYMIPIGTGSSKVRSGNALLNDNSFSRWIIDKSFGLSKWGVERLGESVRVYVWLVMTSQVGQVVVLLQWMERGDCTTVIFGKL